MRASTVVMLTPQARARCQRVNTCPSTTPTHMEINPYVVPYRLFSEVNPSKELKKSRVGRYNSYYYCGGGGLYNMVTYPNSGPTIADAYMGILAIPKFAS